MQYSLLQEAMVESPDFQADTETSPAWKIGRDFFGEAVARIRHKIRWPDENLSVEEIEAFEVYRRDAGEVMVTA